MVNHQLPWGLKNAHAEFYSAVENSAPAVSETGNEYGAELDKLIADCAEQEVLLAARLISGVTHDATASGRKLIKERMEWARAEKEIVKGILALSDLSQLPDNWNNEASPAPRPAALREACRLLLTPELCGLPAPHVCLMSGGGVQLEWQASTRDLELKIFPDCSVEYLLVTEGPFGEHRGPLKLEGHLSTAPHTLRVIVGIFRQGAQVF